MKCHGSALWNRLRILTRMCTVCDDVKQGVWNRPIVISVSLRLTGLGKEQRLDVLHLGLAPLERLALVITSNPGCEGKSCVRTCTYYFTCCLYVFTYYYTCCSMHCMRDPSRFLRYPYGPSGLLLVWTTLSSIRRCTTGTSQVQDRGQSAWVVGARVILEMTDDIRSVFIFHTGYVVFIRVCIDSCISRRMSCI